MNPYEVLGIARDAKEEAIKTAYKKLARKWHPDVFQTEADRNAAEVKMKEINAAYDILGTPEKRAAFEAENPASVNVYEYYASKKTFTKGHKKQPQDSVDIEKEKQRKAVLQFLDVEYEHKNEILEMFAELATGAVTDAFSAEEYLEMLELVIEEQRDCISKIQKIVAVAKEKQIKGLDANYRQAQEAIDELTQKGAETPKSLKQAHYVEETRILTEKIHDLKNGFRDRVNAVTSFALLDKTWEFHNDSDLNSVCQKHKSEVVQLLADMQWIKETASARNIEIGVVALGNPNSQYSYDRDEKTLDECKKIVQENKQILDLNLQGLREEFWKTNCNYSTNESGQIILERIGWNAEKYRGNFICPPHISGIDYDAFYWLRGVTSISIPAHVVNADSDRAIELPDSKSLKRLIFTFDTHSHTVNISKLRGNLAISRKGDYICINNKYYWSGGPGFILIDANGIYVYDDKRLCQLNGVKSVQELEESRWSGYQLQIHTWAQVVKKLPNPVVMQFLPISVETIRQWVNMDKTNFDTALSVAGSKSRLIRLYVGLGALGDNYCHSQAEWLISQLNVDKMYRSRLERHPQEKKTNQDPMFSVPKSAVDFVQENVGNEDFSRYVFAFLEGYKMFQSEAKKAGVELSAEFVITIAPQYIFHRKADKSKAFVEQLLEAERDIDASIADKILAMHLASQSDQGSGSKNIVETTDTDGSAVMRYRYFDVKLLQSYLAFKDAFDLKGQPRQRKSFYKIEAENVFLSNDTHAIEIIDGENKRVAIAILSLFDEGELFADIMECENESMDVLEAIRRAVINQKKCNTAVTGSSIGTTQTPRTDRYNKWQKLMANSSTAWAKEASWTTFEYRFESRILGTSYKGYRARFMVDGRQQHLDSPNDWKTRKKRYNKYNGRSYSRRRNRGYL